MRRNLPALIALASIVFFLVCFVSGYILEHKNGTGSQSVGETILLISGFGGFQGIGALLLARRPQNLISRFFVAIGLLVSFGFLTGAYATYAIVTDPGSLPLARAAGWFASWLWYPTLSLALIFVPNYFPDGRLPSPRWRWLPWTATIMTAAFCASFAFARTLDLDLPEGVSAVSNPLSLGLTTRFTDAVGTVAELAFIALLLATAASVLARFRSSSGVMRQQMKWFACGVIFFVLSPLLGLVSPGLESYSFDIALLVIPASVAIAILRYRLYDIDRIINRTIVYAVLTATLGALYGVLVAGLQEVMHPLSGGSDLAIVVTTLLVAALFLPVRQRVQAIVDRRFNRRSYDGVRMVAAFGARLREQVDLDTLRYELLAVVDETMAPAQSSLWLRRPEA